MNRYRGLKPHPEALGVKLLEEGEISRPVRIRAPVEVHTWLRGMNAEELGKLLTEVMRVKTSAMRNTQINVHSRNQKAEIAMSHRKKGKFTATQKYVISALRAGGRLTEDDSKVFTLTHLDQRQEQVKWQTVTSLRSYLYQEGNELKLSDSA